eukprot:CAMPEP_0181324314 /NCGR_PEP_ID=MMETSP1101-20121128/20289_1 /TAXON_ID=46948 /ORGANISM="Rhodomonas abbreviata, Strain Caron Lab Isolate" /LENGTH=427 /DNA_ID=CAMNT_0023432473 /DNA_START=84 /DNA_END=1364 /DNA_ORIENTATION=-
MHSRVILVNVLFVTGLVHAAHAATDAYECSHSSSPNAASLRMPAPEYHCVDRDQNGVPVFVKGMSAMMTYFEGPINPVGSSYQATVNWFGTSVARPVDIPRSSSKVGASPVPVSGAAVLTYDSSFTAANWTSWNTGQSNLKNSFADWDSPMCVPLQMTEAEMAKFCLWTPSDRSMFSPQLKAGLDMTSWTYASGSGVGGELHVCNVGLSTISHFSQEWPNTECVSFFDSINASTSACAPGSSVVEGGMWTNALHFTAQDSFGVVGMWEASSGPLAGRLGPVVLVTTLESGVVKLRGYTCVTNVEDGSVEKCWAEELTLSSSSSPCDATLVAEPRDYLPSTCLADMDPELEIREGGGHGPAVVNATTEMMMCMATRTVNANTSVGEKEYHCIDYDDMGYPTAVRGTYGQRGYFEGKMDWGGTMASVSW